MTSLGENYGQIRVDQTFSDKDTFFARYTIDNAIQNETVGDYSYFREAPTARNQWITLAENHIFSPTVFNAVRFSFSRTNAAINSRLTLACPVVPVPNSCRVLTPA